MPLTFGTLFHADLTLTVGWRRGGDMPAQPRFRELTAKPFYPSRDAALRQDASAHSSRAAQQVPAGRPICSGEVLAPGGFLGFNLSKIG
jgi:hypothetical protein